MNRQCQEIQHGNPNDSTHSWPHQSGERNKIQSLVQSIQPFKGVT